VTIKNDSFRDMERDKFIESPTRPTLPAVEVSVANAGEVGGGLPFAWDNWNVDRTNATSDVYNYLLGATPTGTVTILFTDSTKCVMSGGNVVKL
jgi:hypothetical protein